MNYIKLRILVYVLVGLFFLYFQSWIEKYINHSLGVNDYEQYLTKHEGKTLHKTDFWDVFPFETKCFGCESRCIVSFGYNEETNSIKFGITKNTEKYGPFFKPLFARQLPHKAPFPYGDIEVKITVKKENGQLNCLEDFGTIHIVRVVDNVIEYYYSPAI